MIFASARDITERIRAERELVESEAQFRGLVEQSIAGIYIIQDDKFVYVNPRFAEIRRLRFGRRIDRARSRCHWIAENDRGTVAENNRRLIAGETQSIGFNFTALRKDGSVIEVGVHGSRATYRGRPAIIGLLQDISEKKRAEEQIQRYVVQLEDRVHEHRRGGNDPERDARSVHRRPRAAGGQDRRHHRRRTRFRRTAASRACRSPAICTTSARSPFPPRSSPSPASSPRSNTS